MGFDTTQKKEKRSFFGKKKDNKRNTTKRVLYATDVLPVKGILDESEGGFIRLKDGYMDILQLGGYNLMGMEQSEISEIVHIYEALSLLYVLPYKVV